MLGGADVDCSFRTIELRPRFEELERRPDLCCARSLPSSLVIAAPQERAKPLAPDGPGFSVAIELDVSKCGADRGVKQVLRSRDVDEHVARSVNSSCRRSGDVVREDCKNREQRCE